MAILEPQVQSARSSFSCPPFLPLFRPGHPGRDSTVFVPFRRSIGMTCQMHSIFHALHVRHFHPAHVDRRSCCRLTESSAPLPPPSTLCIVFLVCSEIERDEEEKVGGDDTHARKSSKLFTSAFASGR